MQPLLPLNSGNAPLSGLHCPSSSNQLNKQYYQSNHEHQVNQTAGYVKRESKQPKYQQNYKDCPKHVTAPPTGSGVPVSLLDAYVSSSFASALRLCKYSTDYNSILR